MVGEGGKGGADAHPGPPFSTVLGNLIIVKTKIVSLSFKKGFSAYITFLCNIFLN